MKLVFNTKRKKEEKKMINNALHNKIRIAEILYVK